MTGIVNRSPAGLLSLLDMKSRGQAPRELDGRLQASIEALDLYTFNSREFVIGNTTTASAIGLFTGSTTGPTTVPATEVWYVHGFHVATSGALAAGTTYRIAPAVSWLGIANQFVIGAASQEFVAGEVAFAGADFSMLPRWWGPNFSASVWVSQHTAGTSVGFNTRMLISRFQL